MAAIKPNYLRHLLLAAQLLRPSVASPAQTDRVFDNTCVWGINSVLFPFSLSTCSPLVNEFTASLTGKWSPWSHRPACSTRMDEHSPQYCLFTDDTFRGGHGISIFTTAEIAASVASALDDSSIPPSFRDLPSGGIEAPYRFIDIPGRGKGTVATRKIKALETIIMSHPAILTINDIEGASYEEIMGLLHKAVDQLPSQERDNVYSLGQSNAGELPLLDIIWTNSFGLDLSGVRHMGVFPESSVCLTPRACIYRHALMY